MTEYIMVPVPADLVPEVFELITKRLSTSSENAQQLSIHPAEWDENLIERAYVDSVRTAKGMQTVFDYLSEHPGREIDAKELCEGIKRQRTELPGILGAFSRRAKNRYGMGTWPFEAREDYGRGGMMVYKMDDRVATIVRHVSDNQTQTPE